MDDGEPMESMDDGEVPTISQSDLTHKNYRLHIFVHK